MWKRRMFSVLLAVSLAALAPGLPVTADAEEFSLFVAKFSTLLLNVQRFAFRCCEIESLPVL